MGIRKDRIIMALENISQDVLLTESIARDLEATILEIYPDADDDELFEDLLHMLASYEPYGGDFLYDEKRLKEECGRVLNVLRHL